MQRESRSEGQDAHLSTEDIASPGRAVPEETRGEPLQRPDSGGAGTAGRDVAAGPDQGERDEPLLGREEAESLGSRWAQIQTGFVDDPQEAVRAADSLVAEVMQMLATTFAAHKQGLESQWEQGGQVQTEDLRIALQRYRSFFHRLLST